MKNNLQACRQALLRELHRINREIALTENKITQLRSNIADMNIL